MSSTENRITLDRTKSIAAAAADAGLAEPPNRDGGAWTFGPALKAKLAEMGADVVGLNGLTFDQAAELEAFIGSTTIIEFERGIGTDENGDRIIETVNAAVSSDEETACIDLPEGGQWECDKEALRAALA